MTKRIISWLTTIVMVISLICIFPAEASSTVSFDFNAPYQQTSARTMTEMINDFRIGSDAWYWNETNTAKVTVSGLSSLTFDYELEEVAMQRAAELVFKYAHERPDGSQCFTAYTSSFSNSTKGENIAIGTTNMTAEHAFDLWKEDKEPYSGQGHRRNMLDSHFQYVGIAHVYYQGCHYWVQEFSSKSGSTTKTTALDTEKKVTVDVDSSTITKSSLTLDSTSASIGVNGKVTLPTANCLLRLAGTWSYAPDIETIITPIWSVTSGSSCVTLSDNTVTGENYGTAELTASFNGMSAKYTVTVDHNFDSGTVTVDHNFDSGTITKEATCTETGTRIYKCTSCGATKTETIAALGHNYSTNWTTDVAATCITAGSKSHHCTRCNAKSDVTAIPATGHNYQNGTCTICGEKDPDYEQPSQNPSENPSQNQTNSSNNNSNSSSQNATIAPTTDSTKSPAIKATQATTKSNNTKPTVTKPAKVKSVKLTAKKKKLNVTWKKISGVTGYEVKVATNSKLTKGKKTVTVKKNKVTIKMLKSKKKYYVKVRAYKTLNGNTYYGKWSKVVKKKVR